MEVIMKKIVFLDIDGTLVNYDNTLPDSAKRAIQKARRNGHLVYACTGRSKAEMPDYILDIGLDGLIGGNGAYVEHNHQVIMHQMLSAKEVQQIVDWLHERKLEFFVESNNGLFASEHFREVARPVMQQYTIKKGKTKEEVENQEVEDVLHGLVFGGNLYRDDVNKISFVLNSIEDYQAAKQAFPNLKAGTWSGVGETALFGDLGVKDITKAHAIEILLDFLQAKREDTIAFGDAKVDIPMLDYCQIGVAMGNGGEEIKAMADMITDSVENDGLAKAFEKLGLI